MTENTRPKSSSRGRRKVQFSPVQPQPASETDDPVLRGIGTLRFEHSFPDGRRFRCDMTGTLVPRLVAPLVGAHYALLNQPSGPSSPGAAKKYAISIRSLVTQLEQIDRGLTDISDLEGHHLDRFEALLREAFKPDSQEPYQKVLRIVLLLRKVRELGLAALQPTLIERLGYVANGGAGTSVPLDAFSEYIQKQLRRACRVEIQRTVRRLTSEADARLAGGRDPRVGGWSNPDDVLWEINRVGTLSQATLHEHLSVREAALLGLRELHRTMYPTQRDLVPFVILLMLEMDIEPECLRELRTDCLQNAAEGRVDVERFKRRARDSEHKTVRVRDQGSTSPGGLIRMVLTLTRKLRTHYPSERLWICFDPIKMRICDAKLQRQSAELDFIDQFIAEHEIVDDEGKSFRLDDLRRLRKSYKQSRYRESGGQLSALAGHSADVAASHYADIPALRDTHEQTVEIGAWGALRPALDAVTVIPPDAEAAWGGDAARVALELGVTEAVAAALLAGDNDSYTAACAAFYDSPWAEPGQACPVPTWGCLLCRNAVITSRKLPNILLLLKHTLEQREALEENEWALKWGEIYLAIVVGILPQFPQGVISEAQAIAESGGAALLLPPELLAY